jgi:hypothetical protein
VAGLLSIHHILWYALAIRQHSDFGITAAVGRKRPCNRRLVTALVPKSVHMRILRGNGYGVVRQQSTRRACGHTHISSHHRPASDFHPWENHCLGAAIPLLRLGEYERALQCLAGLQKPTTGCPTVPLPRSLTLDDLLRAIVLVTSNAPRAIQRNVGSFRAPSKN